MDVATQHDWICLQARGSTARPKQVTANAGPGADISRPL